MTVEKRKELELCIAELTGKIQELQKERRKLSHRLSCGKWHDKAFSKPTDKTVKTFTAMEVFGKQYKDLTKDELREYKKLKQREWRKLHRVTA